MNFFAYIGGYALQCFILLLCVYTVLHVESVREEKQGIRDDHHFGDFGMILRYVVVST